MASLSTIKVIRKLVDCIVELHKHAGIKNTRELPREARADDFLHFSSALKNSQGLHHSTMYEERVSLLLLQNVAETDLSELALSEFAFMLN